MSLARSAADVPAVFAARFNAACFDKGSLSALAELYEPGAVMVGPEGPTSDYLETLRGHLEAREPIEVRPRRVIEAGDVALLVVDWSIGDIASGTTTDVARRGADGFWRYVIDSPFGVA